MSEGGSVCGDWFNEPSGRIISDVRRRRLRNHRKNTRPPASNSTNPITRSTTTATIPAATGPGATSIRLSRIIFSFTQNFRQHLRIDITAGQNYSHAVAVAGNLLLQHGGGCGGA